MGSNGLAEISGHLERIVALADQAFSRARPDRTSDAAPLQPAVLGLLGWAICEAYCVIAGLVTKTPQGVAPNVRSMLEALITAKYLAAPAETAEADDRLDRYYRGVRRAQIVLRDAVSEYAPLKAVYAVDQKLAEGERNEYKQNEGSLPPERRLRKHWSGKPEGLKTMADIVGLGADYAVQYRLHSGSTHGNRPWDQALFDPQNTLIVPSLEENRGMGLPLAFDALRYLAWILAIAHECGAVAFSQSEQDGLQLYRKYCEPMDVLHEKGIVGAG
jgi:uncharacterized protein DUF5677